ncbi:hypothetical protein GCM10027040_14610 [Halomonas shantousis]
MMRHILAALAMLGLLVGCADARLNMKNYDRLEAGMTRSEVEAVIGEPRQCSGALVVANCFWGNKQHFIQAQFVSGRAVTYQYHGLK